MSVKEDITRQAALLVVDEGMEYGPAKHRAVKLMRLGRAPELPDNDAVEAEVRLYLEELDDPAHAQALHALRASALQLMAWLARFRPYITGAVWRGTATAHSDIHLHLFTDDTKDVEMELANRGVDFGVSTRTSTRTSTRSHTSRQDEVEVLSFTVPASLAGRHNTVHHQGYAMAHLSLYRALDERGALKLSANGEPVRGTQASLERLLAASANQAANEGEAA
jgi:isoleucyl-tRNA synthetase